MAEHLHVCTLTRKYARSVKEIDGLRSVGGDNGGGGGWCVGVSKYAWVISQIYYLFFDSFCQIAGNGQREWVDWSQAKTDSGCVFTEIEGSQFSCVSMTTSFENNLVVFVCFWCLFSLACSWFASHNFTRRLLVYRVDSQRKKMHGDYMSLGTKFLTFKSV